MKAGQNGWRFTDEILHSTLHFILAFLVEMSLSFLPSIPVENILERHM